MTPEQWAEIQARDSHVIDKACEVNQPAADRRALIAHASSLDARVRELEALNRGDLIGSVRRLTERCCKPKDERITALEAQLAEARQNIADDLEHRKHYMNQLQASSEALLRLREEGEALRTALEGIQKHGDLIGRAGDWATSIARAALKEHQS